MDVAQLLTRARSAARTVARLDGATRDAALDAIADAIEARSEAILAANREDVEAAIDILSLIHI